MYRSSTHTQMYTDSQHTCTQVHQFIHIAHTCTESAHIQYTHSTHIYTESLPTQPTCMYISAHTHRCTWLCVSACTEHKDSGWVQPFSPFSCCRGTSTPGGTPAALVDGTQAQPWKSCFQAGKRRESPEREGETPKRKLPVSVPGCLPQK